MERLLTIEEISSALGVSQKTIYKWSHLGTIPIARAGRLLRFDEAAVMEWLRRKREPVKRQRAIKTQRQGPVQIPRRRADAEVNNIVKSAICDVLK